ncbi:MAG: hypothetical protein FJW80_06980 [Actinobacteria bacterium]|nr:hypothetical protein [Actinomycetota bacterium]
MAMDLRHALLFEPVQIGPKTLPNRFYQVPHATGFGSIKPRSQAAFRGMKAEGGWGGVCVEYAPVSRDSEETPAVAAEIWDDLDTANLRLTAEAVHKHGALVGIEPSMVAPSASMERRGLCESPQAPRVLK